MTNITFWAIFTPSGKVIRWIGALPTRAEAIRRANEGCMGCNDYDRLGNDSDRWNFVYRRGYRAKRVRLVTDAEAK